MPLSGFLPFLIATHVALAISLFLPSILLPFALRLRGGQWREQQGRVSPCPVLWRAWARRQHYVSYVMATLVGLIAFLMSTKPDL